MNKAFFNFIQSKILTNVPAIKSVEIYRQQMEHQINKKDDRGRAYPCCFVEFVVQETRNLSLGVKNVDLICRFRFALVHMTFTRPQDLDFIDAFDAYIQLLRGNSTDPVQFSSFQEVMTQHDNDFSDVDQPYIEYITCWRKLSGYKRNGFVTKNPPIASQVTGQLL